MESEPMTIESEIWISIDLRAKSTSNSSSIPTVAVTHASEQARFVEQKICIIIERVNLPLTT